MVDGSSECEGADSHQQSKRCEITTTTVAAVFFYL